MNTKSKISLSFLIAFSLFSILSQAQNGVSLSVKVYLQGALIGVPEGEVLMRDDLRTKGFLPAAEPFTDLTAFVHAAPGGGETITDPEVFETDGEEAIVDWVMIELRDPDDYENILHTRAALLRRDAEIVDVDGVSSVFFEGVPEGNYLVAVRHRNHLGVMTEESFNLSSVTTSLDMTAPGFAFFCNYQIAEQNGLQALWAGDINHDGRVILQGPGTDVFQLFLKVLSDPLNEFGSSNFVSYGYDTSDINMDGKTNYAGPGNERLIMWQYILGPVLAGGSPQNWAILGCIF